MTVRTFIYSLLTQGTILAAMGQAPDTDQPRVFAKKSMTSAVEDHPYIVYKLGNGSNLLLSEEVDVEDQYLQVWVHDYTDNETGDYMKIDEVVKAVKATLRLQSSPSDGVRSIEFREVSQDLNDDTLNTLMRYIRFRIIKEQS